MSDTRTRLGCLQLAVEIRSGQQTVDELTSVASQFFDWCKAGQRDPQEASEIINDFNRVVEGVVSSKMPAKKRGRPRRVQPGFSRTA